MLTLLTPPAVEPITLEEAKAHLRVTHDLDDADVADQIAAARELCEGATARSFITTQWRLTLDDFPRSCPRAVVLPRAPVLSIDAVSYLDADGARQTVGQGVFDFEPGDGARLTPAHGQTWPGARVAPGSVRVDFTAGYGPDAASVPSAARILLKTALGYLDANRAGEQTVPQAVADLVSACDWGYRP